MVNGSSGGAISVEFVANDHKVADRIMELAGDGLERRDEDIAGILPVFAAVIVGTITAAAVAQIANWLMKNDECQQIMDFRSDDVKVTVNCEIRNGRIIVVAKDGLQVVVHDVPDLIDITDIAKTAATAGAEKAKEKVEKAGGTADVEPAD